MAERLAHVTIIRKDADKWGDLKPGEMSPTSKPGLWMVCCPLCSGLGELRDHSVTEHEDGTITVSPSLVCNGSVYKAPRTYERCPAHYFVEHNAIRWV